MLILHLMNALFPVCNAFMCMSCMLTCQVAAMLPGAHFLRCWQSSESIVLPCRKRKVTHKRRSIGATCSGDAQGIGSRRFLAGTHSRCILHSSQLPVCLQKFALCLFTAQAGPLGHWLACGLVIMGEPEMESLMMTMPVLPTLTYNEAVQWSYLLLHHGVPAFGATLCLEYCLLLTLRCRV